MTSELSVGCLLDVDNMEEFCVNDKSVLHTCSLSDNRGTLCDSENS